MTPSMTGIPPRASVIIPAYNEGRVIGRCLDALVSARDESGAALPLDIVVAANGCTDDTVAISSRYDGVRVLDLPTPSKAGALNAGDQAARTDPKIFLDADIVLAEEALAQLITALETPLPRVGAPTVHFDTSASSMPVQAFYRAYQRIPYVTSGLVGLGVYGMSATGRARFDRFPQLQGDDLFVQRLFRPEERVVVPAGFTVRVPRDLTNLVKVRTRVASGNAEAAQAGDALPDGDFSASTSSTLRALAQMSRADPRLIPAVGIYVGVTVAARIRARRVGSAAWQRDTSTR